MKGVDSRDKKPFSNQSECLNQMDVSTKYFGYYKIETNAFRQDEFMPFVESSESDDISYFLHDALSG